MSDDGYTVRESHGAVRIYRPPNTGGTMFQLAAVANMTKTTAQDIATS